MRCELPTYLGCVLAALGASGAALAQGEYPNRPVEVIVPYSTGGGVSAMARVFAAEAAKLSQQQWIVLNREGAGGIVGFTAIARAKPDGYTMGFAPASPMTNSPFINDAMPFKNEEIEPVCQIFENVFAVVVSESSPIESFGDLMERAKAASGTLSYGHAGPASIPHLSMAAIEKDADVKFNGIPYRGDGQLLVDVMGGTLDFAVPAISSLAGKNLRVLAVLSDKEHPAMPDEPTIAELGYTAISPGLNGLYVPAGTPAAVVQRIEQMCEQVVGSPAFAQGIAGLMQTPDYLPAAEFKARLDETYRIHADLVGGLNLDKN